VLGKALRAIDGYGSIKKLQGLRSTEFGFNEGLER
jgi:hypothetical protein